MRTTFTIMMAILRNYWSTVRHPSKRQNTGYYMGPLQSVYVKHSFGSFSSNALNYHNNYRCN